MCERDTGWIQPYEQSMSLYKYIREGNCTPKKVEERWHRAFCCIAKHLGFNRATRRILWEDLACGNWGHLHQNYEERSWTPEKWLDELSGDCFYCSDRWSLDRLTRCHWMFRQYRWAIWKEVSQCDSE